jgi:hypothetical protein
MERSAGGNMLIIPPLNSRLGGEEHHRGGGQSIVNSPQQDRLVLGPSPSMLPSSRPKGLVNYPGAVPSSAPAVTRIDNQSRAGVQGMGGPSLVCIV